MLEAYLKNKTLKELEAQLPKDAAQVKHTLKTLLEDQALEEQPSNMPALLILARCYLLCEELNEAKHTLETLLSHDPGNVSAKVELAQILFDENDTDAAARLLTEATNAAPEIVENWHLLSEYLQHNEDEQARENALMQYDMIKAFNDNLAMAEKAFANAEFVRADNLCRKLQQQVPNEVRVLRLLARLANQFRHFENSN